MATVELSFTPLPAHVRTARLVAAAVARRSGVDESLLDEVRLAVGEACSRAVEEHRLHCPTEPVRLALTEEAGRFEVEVTDTSLRPAGPGTGPGAVPGGFGIAVIAGLADDVQISETSAGTSIRMSWPSAVTAS
jgi:serine/threonine-protein kinase RsbW